MKLSLISSLLALMFALTVAAPHSITHSIDQSVNQPEDITYFAVASLRGSYYASQVLGYVTFHQPFGPGSVTRIVANISGMPAGSYAFHVHTFGDLTSSIGGHPINTSTSGVGTHFNPFGAPHGCDSSGTSENKFDKHVGDIGNFTVVGDVPYTVATFESNLIDLSYSNQSIVGRSVILHRNPDICVQPTGGAGEAIIQGVIGIGNPYLNPYFPYANNATNLTVNGANLPLVHNDNHTDPSVSYSFPSFVAAMMPWGSADRVGYQQPNGTVRFSYNVTFGGVDVYVHVTGLGANSVHGLHVHQYGDDFDSSINPYMPRAGSYHGDDHFANAGTHYDPYDVHHHGFPENETRHSGDLGNVTADMNGVVRMVMLNVSLIDVRYWNTSIIGRAVILHLHADNGSQPTGGAGDRLFAGVIGVSDNALSHDVDLDFSPFEVAPFDPYASSSSSSTGLSSSSSEPDSSSSVTFLSSSSVEPIDSSSTGGAASSDTLSWQNIVIIAAAASAGVLLFFFAMYIRFSYVMYDSCCHVCECGGCIRYWCGGRGGTSHEQQRLIDDDDYDDGYTRANIA